MKRILAILPIFLLLTFAANAQARAGAEQQTAQERAHTAALRMKKVLELTDAQTAQVETVLLSKIEAIDKLKADQNLTPEARQAAIQEVKAAKDVELQAILTADQFTRYKAMQAEREQRSNAQGGR